MVQARLKTAASDCAAGGWEKIFREMLADVRRAEPCCDDCFDELLTDRVRHMVAARAVAFEMDARTRADEAFAAGFAAGTAVRRGHLSLVPGQN